MPNGEAGTAGSEQERASVSQHHRGGAAWDRGDRGQDIRKKKRVTAK